MPLHGDLPQIRRGMRGARGEARGAAVDLVDCAAHAQARALQHEAERTAGVSPHDASVVVVASSLRTEAMGYT